MGSNPSGPTLFVAKKILQSACFADTLRLERRGGIDVGGLPLISGAPLPPPPSAPGDPDHLPVHQGVGDFSPCFVEIPPEGLSRDPEGKGCLFLFEPRKVDEPEGLDLLGEDDDNLIGPPAEGAETTEGSPLPDPPADPGPAPPVATAALAWLSLIHGSTIS